MKLVKNLFDGELLIVEDDSIKDGIYFSNESFFTNADPKHFEYFKDEVFDTDGEYDMADAFANYLRSEDVEYRFIYKRCMPVEMAEIMINDWKYFYEDDREKYIESSELLKYKVKCVEVSYDYRWAEVCVLDTVEEIETCIEVNIEKKAQVDLYKGLNTDAFIINHKKIGNESLGYAEEIKSRELLTQYDYMV